MDQNAWERLESVLKYSNMTANRFALYIGLARGENLYQIKRGNNGISLDLATRICERFPEIDKLWLLTGDGDMFGSDVPIGLWSSIGTAQSEAFRGYAAVHILAKLIYNEQCKDPYTLAVEHAARLQAALAKAHKA